VHRFWKDSVLDADDQVEVIAHQAERGARPRRSFRNSSKLGEEGDAVAGVAKERGRCGDAVRIHVERSGSDVARRAGHPAGIPAAQRERNCPSAELTVL